jgi:hypothetical protein
MDLLFVVFASGLALGYLLSKLSHKETYNLMAVITVPADAELKLNFNGEVRDSKGNLIENATVVVNAVEVETSSGNWGTVAEDSDEAGEWDLRFQDAGASATLKATGTVNDLPATGRVELAVAAGAPARASIAVDMVVDED